MSIDNIIRLTCDNPICTHEPIERAQGSGLPDGWLRSGGNLQVGTLGIAMPILIFCCDACMAAYIRAELSGLEEAVERYHQSRLEIGKGLPHHYNLPGSDGKEE